MRRRGEYNGTVRPLRSPALPDVAGAFLTIREETAWTEIS